MQNIYPLFFNPGEVVEIRAMGLRGRNPAWEGFAGGKAGIVSGFFDDPGKFAKAAADLDKAGARGVYYTANPVNPVLLARASNRLTCPQEGETTNDLYIECIRWFLIDLDSLLADGKKRPKGISASDEEVKTCEKTAGQVAAWLEEERGFARGIRGFSGNGYHLLYRLADLPNDGTQGEIHQVIVKAMAALAAQFPKGADIDVAVVNPARIWKLYGTTGRKGDSTKERPHRKSYLFKGQPETLAEIPVTDLRKLRDLAGVAASPPETKQPPKTPVSAPASTKTSPGSAAPPQATRFKNSELGPLQVDRYLEHYGIAYRLKENGGQTMYCLDRCLFNPDHTGGDAYIGYTPNSPLIYKCFHSSCADKKWKDAKAAISGNKKLPEFCAGYDPAWKPPESNVGTGAMKDLQVQTPTGIESTATVMPPEQVDPQAEFFEKRGARPVFVPMYLANYLAAYLAPLVHTDGVFWRYRDGLWTQFPKNTIEQVIVKAMREHSQAAFIENSMKILSRNINQEEIMWPKSSRYINVKNGMIDTEDDMKLLPHDPAYGSRARLPVNYRPEAKFSERWEKALEDFFPGDDKYAKRGLLSQFYGYCLLPDCRFQKALFLFGTGSNGKSTVLDVLQAMVGDENTCSLSLTDLTQRFKTQFLQGKLVNLATETNTKDPLAVEMLKAIISGDPITAERKFGDQFQFRPYAKFVVAMNDAPIIPDKSYGFGRRLIVLNFERRFTEAEIIPRMSEYLIEEIDGIFKWAILGLKSLLKSDGFQIPESVRQETAEFQETLNPLLIFVNEMCAVNDKVWCTTTELWDGYAAWCESGKNRALGRNKFLDQVRQTFVLVKREQVWMRDGVILDASADREGASNVRIFAGIGITPAGQEWLREYQEKRKYKKWEDR